jgi:putative aldouronate transport system substrate-binding protein
MKKLTRREMLKLTGISSVGVVLAACAPSATPTAEAPKTADATAAPEATKAPDATKAPEPTAAPAKKPLVKITMVESWFGIPQFKESIDPVTTAISKKMQDEGVNIEIESMVLDDHEKKYTVLYASGADFTMAFDAPWYKMTTLRTQGALATLEGFVEQYGKNLKAEITDKIYNANLIDGKLYGIPAAYYYSGTSGVILREDLRKKYNAEAPTSEGGYASLEPYLAAIKKNEPTMIPFANINLYPITDLWGHKLGWGAGAPTKTGVMVENITKDFKIVNTEDMAEWTDMVKLLRSWWEKGLVNKTDLTSSGPTQAVENDYIYPGKAAACQENEPDFKFVDFNKQMQAANKDAALMGYELQGLRSGKVKGMGALKAGNFIVVNGSAGADQQQAAVEYFDWMTTNQDNMDLWLMGIDGENYKKEDNLRYSEIAGVDQTRNYRRMWYVSGLSGKFQRQPLDLPKEAEEALTFFSTESNWVFNPYEAFEPDVKALEVDTAKLNAVYDEAVHGAVTGQLSADESIKKMKKMLDEAGRPQFMEKLQKQLDDYIAAHKA